MTESTYIASNNEAELISSPLSDIEHPVGVGLRHLHYQQALDDKSSSIDFVEIHAENFFVEGGLLTSLLKDITDKFPLSVHGTSLGLGSEVPVDESILKKFAQLVEITQPAIVSEHICFNRALIDGQLKHSGDLLPIPYNSDSLSTICAQIQRVQDRIRRPLLIENLSAYLSPSAIASGAIDEMSEIEFLTSMCRSSGAGLLLDLNNLLINALNRSENDPVAKVYADLLALPFECVGEVHVAGFSKRKTHGFYVDDHGTAVTKECWQLLKLLAPKLTNVPVLVEWDTQLPPWETLVEQAKIARSIMTKEG